MVPCAFYTASDARFFVATAALLNSLRRAGHDEPLVVLDNGLLDDQRDLLDEAGAVMVEAEHELHPLQAKHIVLTLFDAEVRVNIDSDMIVVRNLEPEIELARQGKLVACADYVEDRFFASWGEWLGSGPLERKHSYLNAGLYFLPARAGELLARQVEFVKRLDPEETRRVDRERIAQLRRQLPQEEIGLGLNMRGAEKTPRLLDSTTFYANLNTLYRSVLADSPFAVHDQDVFNALVNQLLEPEDVVALPHELAPWPRFPGLDSDLCYEDGTQPLVLHAIGWKPFLVPLPWDLYQRELQKLLSGPALQVPRKMVPSFIRPGQIGQWKRRLRFTASLCSTAVHSARG